LGAIFFSVDIELIRALKGVLPLSEFIETGTFQGATTELVAPLFARVRTIELSETLHARAVTRLAKLQNVECLQGDAPKVLREVTPALAQSSVLYWLDAHWCGSETAGQADECPLLNELEAIGSLNEQSVVLIDDARLFLAPPPAPHNAAHWPTLDVVAERLRRVAARHSLWVINDILIFAPPAAFDVVVEYGRTRGVDLHSLVQQLNHAQQAAAQPSPAPPPPQQPVHVPPHNISFNAEFLGGERSERIFAYHLHRLGLTRVLDIGANSGQFAAKLRQSGYTGSVFSVEPQASAHRQLVEHTRQDMRWFALARQGAGAAPAMLDMNIAENGWSSSLRPVHANHVRAEPTTRTVMQERVFINQAGQLLRPEVLESVAALKIDVQGYEDQVLAGYESLLGGVRLLLLELSLVECYEGAPTLFSLDKMLVERHGFSRVSLEPAYYDDKTGTVQQYDGIYFRPEPKRIETSRPDGVRIGAVVTSIGGALTRKKPDGTDVGEEWLQVCMKSWRAASNRVLSVAESAPPAGLEWVRTETRPSITAMLTAERVNEQQALLLTNADIAFDSELFRLLPTLDSFGVYYGHRMDIEPAASNPNQLAPRGIYEWGFDYFIVPQAFADALESSGALPPEFLVGEPWWDYALPVAALALGFPLKRLTTQKPFAFHYAHPMAIASLISRDGCWSEARVRPAAC
jgi:FkbM family methyltransferase